MAQVGSNSLELLVLGKFSPWIIYSRVFNHMTSCSYLFSFYYPCLSIEKFRIANGSFSSITSKRNVKISKKVTLKSVLHVPKLACNLLSISRLSKDSNYSIRFLPSTCVFQHQNLRKDNWKR